MTHRILADLTGIVLAGGDSRRMGTNKAFLEVGGTPMVRRVLDALAVCCAEVILVAKDPAAYAGLGVRVVADYEPVQAPLAGTITGLRALATPYAFVAACDLPFLSPDVVTWMASLAPGHDAVVPRVDGRWHPLHAVYAVQAGPALERAWASGIRRMRDAFERLRIREITAAELAPLDPSLRSLQNINTPAEYLRVLDEIAARDADKEGPAPIANN
jgi:molybdopterin-guanine dinucleotide biosynthesis protein A